MLARTTMNAGDANRAVYDREPGAYDGRALEPAERVLLRRFRDRWAGMSVLDIGVGSGRTAYTFAALAKRYVGIDYSPVMIDLARERIGEDETTRFAVCDAREMAATLGERFDLALFSFNGIDSVGHEDRLAILSQVRELLEPDGHFFFSTHSILTLPLRASRPQVHPLRPVRSAYRVAHALRHARKLAGVNRGARGWETRGWAQLRDDAHDFQGLWYYVLPEYQVTQLGDAGLEVLEVYDVHGRPVDPRDPGRGPWLHWLCAPAT